MGDRTARRHLLHAVSPNGTEITIPTVIVLTIRDDDTLGLDE